MLIMCWAKFNNNNKNKTQKNLKYHRKFIFITPGERVSSSAIAVIFHQTHKDFAIEIVPLINSNDKHDLKR